MLKALYKIKISVFIDLHIIRIKLLKKMFYLFISLEIGAEVS